MRRLVTPGLRAAALAGLAALVLAPAAGATDDRLFLSRPPVLVDGTGEVMGPAFVARDGAVRVWLRIGARDVLLTATRDSLGLDPTEALGRVAFEEADCSGPRWFLPIVPFPLVVALVALGPDNHTLFAPDGPPEFVGLNSSWEPGSTDPCRAEGGGLIELQRAVGILDLRDFPPPYTVR